MWRSPKWRREGKTCQCELRGKFVFGRARDEGSSQKNDDETKKTERQMGNCGQAWESGNSSIIRGFLSTASFQGALNSNRTMALARRETSMKEEQVWRKRGRHARCLAGPFGRDGRIKKKKKNATGYGTTNGALWTENFWREKSNGKKSNWEKWNKNWKNWIETVRDHGRDICRERKDDWRAGTTGRQYIVERGEVEGMKLE